MVLRLWQSTSEYTTRLNDVRSQVEEIESSLHEEIRRGVRFMGILDSGNTRFDANCEPEALLQTNLDDDGEVKIRQAFTHALQYGSEGYWDLDELYLFSRCGGTIVAQALFDLGFSRNRKGLLRKVEDGEQSPREGYERAKRPILQKADMYEYKRFGFESQALTLGNYEVVVGKTGLVFFSLQNDLGGTVRYAGFSRGHLAMEQDGFSLSARNVRFLEDAAVAIDAKKNGQVRKVVIPAKVSGTELARAFDYLC